jgi:hypothetical protein
MADPTYGNDIQASTLDDLVMGVAIDNFFIDDPKLEWMRTIGAVDPFDGGILKRYATIINRPMGGAAAPGTTQNIVHRQQIANLAFNIRNYSTWDMLETFSLEVNNRGANKRVDLMDLYAQEHIRAINTDVGTDSFHHGQSPVAGYITDDGSERINGDDEAMNNGFDPGWYGNVYTTYGNQARNGAATNTLNSTPMWYGNPDGSCASFSVERLILHIRSVKRYGADNFIGISSVEGISYMASALQRQQRLVEWKVEDTCPDFTGIGFMGCMFYESGLAPGRAWAATLPPNISATSNATDTAGTRTDGNGPYSFTSPATCTAYSGIPASTQISVGEPLFIYAGSSIEYWPTTSPEFFFGVRKNQVYNSNSLDSYIVNFALGMNFTMPRKNRLGYGFSS